MVRAFFFDRDGVINDDKDYYYVTNPEMFHVNSGAINFLKHVKKSGFLSILVTNQAGIDKGLYTHKDVEAIHVKMNNILSGSDLGMDEIYY